MKRIAIVEDDARTARQLQADVQQYAQQSGQSLQVDCFQQGDSFLQRYTPIYAVVLMDIQMQGRDGMQTARELRRMDKNISILFISSLSQYALQGYEVDAVSFLVKPVRYPDLALKLDKALEQYNRCQNRTLLVPTAGGLHCLSTDQLLYVEVSGHRLLYHTLDGTVQRSGSLSVVEQELNSYGFLRCNQCYLVNPRFVTRVEDSQVFLGNEKLQISRPRRANFLAELADWYAGRQTLEAIHD